MIPFEEAMAAEMYTAYCAAVGGVAFNGDPLPTWYAFRADPAKKQQSDAWSPTQLHGLARIATMMQAQNISAVLVDERDLNAWPSTSAFTPSAAQSEFMYNIVACSEHPAIKLPFEHKRGPKPLPYWRTLKGRKR